MGVFNATQNQYIAKPVTSFYQGKALRQAQADKGQVAELRELQIEQAEKDLNAEPTPEEIETKELELEKLRLGVKEKRDELGDAEMQRRANAYGPIIDEATKISESGDIDGAIEFANKELRIAAESLGPDVIGEFNKAKGEDGVLDKEEISRIKFGIQAYYEMAEEDEKDPSQLINMYNPDSGERIAVRSKSPEADEAAANGFLVGSNSDKVLGLGDARGGTVIKAADEGFILRMVGQHFGGLFDEKTQQVSFLDATKQRRASQVTALATNLFADGVAKTLSDSVKKALIAYGEPWEEPREIGSIIEKGGKQLEIIGFDDDGEPLVREVG